MSRAFTSEHRMHATVTRVLTSEQSFDSLLVTETLYFREITLHCYFVWSYEPCFSLSCLISPTWTNLFT